MRATYPRRLGGFHSALVIITGAVLLAGCGGGSPSAGGKDVRAARTLTQAIAATRAAGTAHLSVHATSGPNSVVYSSDAAKNAGRQEVTAGDGGRATVLEVNEVGYFNGDAKALAGFLNTPPDVAQRVAGKWISFHAGDPGYHHIISGVTLDSIADQLRLSGQVKWLGTRTMAGRPVIGLRGGLPLALGGPPGITATLFVSASGTPLPVSFEGGLGGQAQKVTFSRWGEPVHVTAPDHAVPSSTVLSR